MPIRLFASTTDGAFISAHRGFSARAPENTLPALQAALEAGAHVAEIDVRLTRDGKLVLMHDSEVDRTTDGSGAYRIVDLRPGIYSVSFTLTGFNVVRREGIELTGAGVTTIGMPIGFGVIVFTIVITGIYVRRANSEYDALSEQVAKEVLK